VTRGEWTLGAVFLVLCGLVGAVVGAGIGVLVLAVWLLVNPPRWTYWAAALALMALAPVALVAQGLTTSPIAGPGFGTSHMVAHWLVMSALFAAGFAAGLEILEVPEVAIGEGAEAAEGQAGTSIPAVSPPPGRMIERRKRFPRPRHHVDRPEEPPEGSPP
jgi:hypothetical protein